REKITCVSSAPFSMDYLFFSSRRRHTRSKRDWSSDVCSSDLGTGDGQRPTTHGRPAHVGHRGGLRNHRRGRVRSTEPRRTHRQRSEERRVGKECRARGWPKHYIIIGYTRKEGEA